MRPEEMQPQVICNTQCKIATIHVPTDWELHIVSTGEPTKADKFKALKLQYLVGAKGKIECIKEIRGMTGWGLKESKDEVDQWKGGDGGEQYGYNL